MSQRKRAARMPDGAAGRQFEYVLRQIAASRDGTAHTDRSRFEAGAMPELDFALRAPVARMAARFGSFEVASVEARTEFALVADLEASDGKKWRVSCRVEETPPHRIAELDWERVLDFDVVVREAIEADAPGLAEIERRCPLHLGDTSTVIDRGDDYFAFARLMEEVTVSFGLIDGEPAGINCGALLTARIDGVDRRIMVAVHTRILPEHQRKGLWAALSRLLTKKYSPSRGVAGSIGYGSVDNAAIQRGFANVPEKWDPGPVRAHLACSSDAGSGIGSVATPADAPRIVELINACHSGEEMYTPYTVESLSARLERSPEQYSWNHVRLMENAVVGVWSAGDTIRVITEKNGQRVESRRGVVLDYGFVPSDDGGGVGEAELSALLCGWCARLEKRGMDTLTVFSSPASPGYQTIRALAKQTEAFYAWTPGIAVPQRLPEAGMYVDAIYF